MMKLPVSTKQNIWFNGESVTSTNLTREQNYNNATQTALINNHIGSGILSDNLTQKVLFDSDLASGLLDGKAIDIQSQPSDSNYGNQIEISLSDSLVAGKRGIKFFLIGLDFQSNLQYDRFTFYRNEKQTSKKHYTKILKIFFNDFIGDPAKSLNLGGNLTIKEAKPFSLSRDCLMVAQDLQPNIFFRDFFVSDNSSLNMLLNNSLPSYNIDTLNIASGYNQLRGIVPNDVTSQVGQKFQASTNNIQKITMLLSVINSIDTNDLEWTGDVIVSIYQLQSAVDCPLDIAPGTAIDFDPSHIPVAQLTFDYDSLKDKGFILNETPQPVDFVFSNTPVGAGTVIKPGSYYAVTVKRAGSADKCTIQLATGTDRLVNAKSTFFNGSIWVDVSDEDLWFQVWTDSAQVTDGQAYDAGHGITIPKTSINPATGISEDHNVDNIYFSRNDTYYALVEATTEPSAQVQDQRTGERVYSQSQFVPNINLLTASNLISREDASDPLIIGTIADSNSKFVNSTNSTVEAKFHHFAMIGNKCVVKVIDDPTDGYRYDLDVLNLITELTGSGGSSNVNGLIEGKLILDADNEDVFYRIADSEVITMRYGDINGDGIVDDDDLQQMSNLIDSDLNSIPTLADYTTLTTPFHTDTGMTWSLLAENGVTVLASGTDGVITADPQDPSRGTFVSASTNFNSFTSLNTKKIQITLNVGNPGNNGKFKINGIVDNHTLHLQKKYYTSDSILQLLRADINGDMIIDSTDLSLLTSYVNKVAPFPPTSLPATKIGKTFTAIRFTLEKYVDRGDDYTASSTRGSDIHKLPDVLVDEFNSGNSLFGRNLKTNPLAFEINKQLTWFDYFVNSSSDPKLVPSSFNQQSGYVLNECTTQGIIDEHYPIKPEFDPGRNDIFLPNNLVINDGGQIVRPDGYFMKMDFEVGTVVLEMPTGSFSSEKIINVFSDFVANFTGDGRTRLGYRAMKFADCSFVGLDALSRGQVRFEVAVRSFSPQINATDADGYSGVLVDGRIGISINTDTGILTLNFTNLYEDIVLQTMKTRVQITVFLKQGGFNNNPLVVTSTKIQNILGLV